MIMRSSYSHFTGSIHSIATLLASYLSNFSHRLCVSMLSTTLSRLTTLLLLFLSGYSAADQRTDSGFYISGGIGAAQIEPGSFLDDETNTIPRVAFGWQLNPYLGAELGYFDFGEMSGLIGDTPPDASGISLAVRGQLPVSSKLALFAKAGQIWWGSDFTITTCRFIECSVREINFDDRDAMLGVGLSYELTDRLEIELEYDYFDFKFARDFRQFNNETSVTSLVLTFEF